MKQLNLSVDEVEFWRSILEDRHKYFLDNETAIKKMAFEELSSEAAGDLSKIPLHSADLASNTQEVEMLESLSERNIKNIQEVEDAFDRLDNGVFGLCQKCKKPILKKRLELIPETRYCMRCEKKIENMHRMYI